MWTRWSSLLAYIIYTVAVPSVSSNIHTFTSVYLYLHVCFYHLYSHLCVSITYSHLCVAITSYLCFYRPCSHLCVYHLYSHLCFYRPCSHLCVYHLYSHLCVSNTYFHIYHLYSHLCFYLLHICVSLSPILTSVYTYICCGSITHFHICVLLSPIFTVYSHVCVETLPQLDVKWCKFLRELPIKRSIAFYLSPLMVLVHVRAVTTCLADCVSCDTVPQGKAWECMYMYDHLSGPGAMWHCAPGQKAWECMYDHLSGAGVMWHCAPGQTWKCMYDHLSGAGSCDIAPQGKAWDFPCSLHHQRLPLAFETPSTTAYQTTSTLTVNTGRRVWIGCSSYKPTGPVHNCLFYVATLSTVANNAGSSTAGFTMWLTRLCRCVSIHTCSVYIH